MKAGVPGVNVLHNICMVSVNIFSRFLMIVGCPNQAHLPSLLLITCTNVVGFFTSMIVVALEWHL